MSSEFDRIRESFREELRLRKPSERFTVMLIKAQIYSGVSEYEISAEENEELRQLCDKSRLAEEKGKISTED